MNQDKVFDQAVIIAEKGLVLVTTADKQGVPHLAAAGSIIKSRTDKIAVTDWFCPKTAENAAPGKPISVVWDSVHDIGHQIIGRVAAVEEIAMLDGYQPGMEEEHAPMPQVERRLLIDVDQVVAFQKAPHSDIEEYKTRVKQT